MRVMFGRERLTKLGMMKAKKNKIVALILTMVILKTADVVNVRMMILDFNP